MVQLTIMECTKNPNVVYDKVSRLFKTYTSKLKNNEKSSKPICVVFDIDDTILCTNENEHGHMNQTTIYIQRTGKSVLEISRKMSFHIVFVTARLGDPQSRAYVISQLKSLNLFVCNELYMQSKTDTNTAKYKQSIRAKLAKKYTILLNCGDQISDFYNTDQSSTQQNYEEKLRAKLNPNTYYFIHSNDNNENALVHLKFPETE